uniref:Uncharacterized protein n=1 Tax=Cyprinus carpio TaxID=7962 RepID=A0A8C1WG43_CYPCA
MTVTLVFVFRFKERLKTKYLRDLRQKQQLSGSLDSHKWRFLSPGLDDFRDGYPTVHKELFTQCKSGPSPALFDQVLSVLDPDMCMKAELSITSPMEHLEESSAQCEISTPETIKPSITIKPQKEKCKEARPRNLYKWQKLKETLGIEDQTASVKHLHSVSQEDDKQMITKLFCEWITSLGGETSDLTESTILDLFKSDYEKKPSWTFPINKAHPKQTPAKLSSFVEGHHKDAKEINQVNKPNRPQAANDPLRAPADITGSLDFEEQLKLKQIHGIQAFREFIINKGVRMPRVMLFTFN